MIFWAVFVGLLVLMGVTAAVMEVSLYNQGKRAQATRGIRLPDPWWAPWYESVRGFGQALVGVATALNGVNLLSLESWKRSLRWKKRNR